jgi:hypothetical protein
LRIQHERQLWSGEGKSECKRLQNKSRIIEGALEPKAFLDPLTGRAMPLIAEKHGGSWR